MAIQTGYHQIPNEPAPEYSPAPGSLDLVVNQQPRSATIVRKTTWWDLLRDTARQQYGENIESAKGELERLYPSQYSIHCCAL